MVTTATAWDATFVFPQFILPFVSVQITWLMISLSYHWSFYFLAFVAALGNSYVLFSFNFLGLSGYQAFTLEGTPFTLWTCYADYRTTVFFTLHLIALTVVGMANAFMGPPPPAVIPGEQDTWHRPAYTSLNTLSDVVFGRLPPPRSWYQVPFSHWGVIVNFCVVLLVSTILSSLES